ncbi:hypothetical protein KRX51_10015 [Corynebacterium sp. TAE3-ERU12]|uniref:hypothetical protein n=1 Tax=Corynebacterium sp. TAE3-ERU12 TaxID=2849491 RepID=UPI001C467E35|nr:hypothetical protein [Corynebacterium sp. TAE3-ERU12]MBV7296246.1 hypothetical protein [Corynebacterium sp. TAE3-ERU12]
MTEPASLRPWLHLVCDGAPPPADAQELADGDNYAAVAELIASLPTGPDSQLGDNLLSAVTGFAGLEHLAVWLRAHAQYRATGTPVFIRIGGTDGEHRAWLRRLRGPGELAELLDAMSPPLARHRDMPPVFGEASRRAHAIDGLSRRCTAFHACVANGEVAVHPGGAATAAAAIATWLGVCVAPTSESNHATGLRLSSRGRDDDGELGYTARIPVPCGLTEHPLSRHDVKVSVRGGHAIISVDRWRRRFTLPAVLGACELTDVEVRGAEMASDITRNGSSDDILLTFRSVAGLLPRTQ